MVMPPPNTLQASSLLHSCNRDGSTIDSTYYVFTIGLKSSYGCMINIDNRALYLHM